MDQHLPRGDGSSRNPRAVNKSPDRMNSQRTVAAERLAPVAAGIPACRRAGLPSPAERTVRPPERVGKSRASSTTGRSSGRQGCAPSTAARGICLAVGLRCRAAPLSRSARGVGRKGLRLKRASAVRALPLLASGRPGFVGDVVPNGKMGRRGSASPTTLKMRQGWPPLRFAGLNKTAPF
jgi:hypothetical protein